MTRISQNGIALVFTLLFTTVLVMLLTATLISTQGGNIFSQDYHSKTAALYAAESGLAMVQARLEEHADFHGPLIDLPTPFNTGTYTVTFGPSVNNLQGKVAEIGPYGPVPPGTAFIRVEGHALGQTEVIECTLGQKSDDFIHAAAVATGKIYLDGNVDIRGHVASEDLSPADADLISNYDKAIWAGPSPMFWKSTSSTSGTVQGTVRSASPSVSAISPDLVAIASKSETDQAPVPVKNVNIRRAIQEKVGNPGMPSPGTALSGTYYEAGDRTVAGDLVLADGSLYVNGDLTVLGSIKGVGAVYVKGDTSFMGDSEVVANEEGIALYSQGNVRLDGFNGTVWMDFVTASHGKAAEWEDTKQGFELLDGYLQNYVNGTDDSGIRDLPVPGGYPSSKANIVINHLANGDMLDLPPYSEGARDNLLWQMLQVIEAEPAGLTRNFMKRKFEALRAPSPEKSSVDDIPPQDINGALGINYGSTIVNTAQINRFRATGVVEATHLSVEIYLTAARMYLTEEEFDAEFEAFATLTAEELRSALIKHTHWIDLYNFDRLGDSYFQGNLYTHGAFFANNEVTIIGSLSAAAEPGEPSSVWTPKSGVHLSQGDIHLAAGTRILHVSDLKPGLRSTLPPVGVSHWLR